MCDGVELNDAALMAHREQICEGCHYRVWRRISNL